MRSLRAQLLAWTTAGTALVLVTMCALLYALIERTLRREFDELLVTRARELSALVEESEDGVEFEPAEAAAPEESGAAEPSEYVELRRAEGKLLARLPPWGKEDLEPELGSYDETLLRTVSIAGGKKLRVVGLRFVPRQEYEGGAKRGGSEVTLAVGRPTAPLEFTLGNVRNILIGVCAVSVLLSGVVLVWVVGRGVKPIQLLSRQIGEVGANGLGRRLEVRAIPTELAPVVERLNDLLGRLEAAFVRERRFTGDVAHELRTPLAGLRAKLEVALSREREGASYRQAMTDCLQISTQMQRMVENLLHLARADAGQLEIRCEPVDLAEMVEECREVLEEKAGARHVRTQWIVNGEVPLSTDAELLRLVVRNLIDNAATYVDEGGVITITTGSAAGAAVLELKNTGSRVSAEQTAQVFDRFWRGDAAYGAEGHCGLGLALCKAIIERLGGSIEAASAKGGEFVATMTLSQDAGPGR